MKKYRFNTREEINKAISRSIYNIEDCNPRMLDRRVCEYISLCLNRTNSFDGFKYIPYRYQVVDIDALMKYGRDIKISYINPKLLTDEIKEKFKSKEIKFYNRID